MLRTLGDFTGDGQLHALAPTGDPRTASWIQFIIGGAPGSVLSATPTRVGDANISATQGAPIPSGGSQFLPWRKRPDSDPYKLYQVYYLAPVGVSVSVLYDDD